MDDKQAKRIEDIFCRLREDSNAFRDARDAWLTRMTEAIKKHGVLVMHSEFDPTKVANAECWVLDEEGIPTRLQGNVPRGLNAVLNAEMLRVGEELHAQENQMITKRIDFARALGVELKAVMSEAFGEDVGEAVYINYYRPYTRTK